jgi:hypothetical protein
MTRNEMVAKIVAEVVEGVEVLEDGRIYNDTYGEPQTRAEFVDDLGDWESRYGWASERVGDLFADSSEDVPTGAEIRAVVGDVLNALYEWAEGGK